MIPRRPVLLALALLAALGLSACGEMDNRASSTDRPPEERLSLLLDYLPNADHVGIYQAQADGTFAKAGLQVDVMTPDDPSSVLKLVAAGRVDVGISYEPEVLLARAQGEDVVAFASVVTRPLTSLMSLPKAKIDDVRDLKGKTVGTAGIPYQTAYLDTIVEQAGLKPSDVKQVDVGFNLNHALISGKVDATLGGFWNVEGVQLQQQHRHPRVIPVNELGVPDYDELVLVAKSTTLDARESAIRRLVRAIGQGYATVRKDPAAGVEPLLKANPDLERKLQLAVTEKTADAFFPKDPKHPWGWLDTDAWVSYAQWMLDRGLLKRKIPMDGVITTDFLPGEGAGDGRNTPSGAASPQQKLPGYRGE